MTNNLTHDVVSLTGSVRHVETRPMMTWPPFHGHKGRCLTASWEYRSVDVAVNPLKSLQRCKNNTSHAHTNTHKNYDTYKRAKHIQIHMKKYTQTHTKTHWNTENTPNCIQYTQTHPTHTKTNAYNTDKRIQHTPTLTTHSNTRWLMQAPDDTYKH